MIKKSKTLTKNTLDSKIKLVICKRGITVNTIILYTYLKIPRKIQNLQGGCNILESSHLNFWIINTSGFDVQLLPLNVIRQQIPKRNVDDYQGILCFATHLLIKFTYISFSTTFSWLIFTFEV